jgi:hypothetical protein
MTALTEELIRALERAIADLGQEGNGSVTLHIQSGRVRQIRVVKVESMPAAPIANDAQA